MVKASTRFISFLLAGASEVPTILPQAILSATKMTIMPLPEMLVACLAETSSADAYLPAFITSRPPSGEACRPCLPGTQQPSPGRVIPKDNQGRQRERTWSSSGPREQGGKRFAQL